MARKGETLTIDQRRKISIGMTGRKRQPFSEEHRRKLSEAKRGDKHPLYGVGHSIETRKKMSRSHTGKRLTPEHRANISKSLMGRKVSEATRAKLRAARLKQVLPVKDTTIELLIQRELDNKEIDYDTHLPVCGICQPDIVIEKLKLVIFCDGDYWHNLPSYIERDSKINEILMKNGWKVYRFWEHEIRADPSLCIDIIKEI